MNQLTSARTPHFALALLVLCSFALATPTVLNSQTQSSAAASNTCPSDEQTSYPKAVISNGVVKAVLYLPDSKNGYYRGQRFDWSGVVGCLAYKGHSYFGVWFPNYDPLLHDAISGPVEEFRSGDGDSALKYDQAKPGDPFVKIGVGVLRKTDNTPYKFATPYPVIDGGKWTVSHRKNQCLLPARAQINHRHCL